MFLPTLTLTRAFVLRTATGLVTQTVTGRDGREALAAVQAWLPGAEIVAVKAFASPLSAKLWATDVAADMLAAELSATRPVPSVAPLAQTEGTVNLRRR